MINPSEELAIPIPRFVPLRCYEYILSLLENLRSHLQIFKAFLLTGSCIYYQIN